MEPMGWRFVVAADLGLPPGPPTLLRPGETGDWLKPLGVSLDLTPPGATSPVRLEFADERSFLPESLPGGGASAEAILQHPSFQRAESVVRGLKLLLDHAGGAVRIDFVSAPAKDLVSRFREAVLEPEMRELRDPPLGLILADYDFSHQGAELAALSELAEMAKVLQAPLVAGGSPGLFGLKQINLLPKLQDLPQRMMDSAHAGWQKFQKQEAARWAVLTVNRFLQRAAHPSEKTDPAKPESFLWGRGVWLVGAAVARSVVRHGHALDVSGAQAGGFAGMPARPYPKLANQNVPLTTEIELPEQAVMELSRIGFTPVCGKMGSDALMLPIAVNAFRSAPGRLTVSGTLAYQMMAGRLARFCAVLLDALPAADGAGFLKKSLTEFLGPLAGKDPDAAVKVAPIEGKDAEGRPFPAAEVSVQPDARIEGMEFRFVFQLPLRRG